MISRNSKKVWFVKKNGLLFFLVSLFFLQPLVVLGQPRPTIQQQQNAAASLNVRQRFNPNATIQGGSTFGGIQFSGVGGALAGCSNIGQYASKGISSVTSVFKKAPSERMFQSGAGLGSAPPAISGTGAPPVGGAGTPGLNVGYGSTQTQLKDLLSKDTNLNKGLSDAASSTGLSAVPVNAANTDKELKKANNREQCLNGVAYAVAKGLLQQITNKTMKWVETGFEGNSLYVKNIDSYLKKVSDEQVNLFLQRIPSQDPVFGNLIRSIVTENVSGIRDGYIDKAMDTPEGRAYQAFQEDFTSGGWEAFLNPRNNGLGAVLETGNQLSQNIGSQKQNIQDQQQRNGGFLDMRKCLEYAKPLSSIGADDDINYIDQQVALSKEKTCIKWETVTPGSAISAQVNTITTSPIRQLEQADQINEVLGSFFDQLLNKLFSFGLSGMGTQKQGILSLVGGTSFGQSSPFDPGTQVGSSGYSVPDFDISRPQYLRAIVQSQYDFVNRALDAQVVLNRIVPTLGALDYCIPGPNPTWREGLNGNASNYFGGLQPVTKENSGLLQAIASISQLVALFTNKEPHAIAGSSIGLFDKASGEIITISDSVYFERNRSPEAVFNNLQIRYGEVLDYYDQKYTEDTIKSAFVSADPSNSAFAKGFVADAIFETANLPAYNQAIRSPEGLAFQYEQSLRSTAEAIMELESIRQEVDEIVAGAKARYIAERAASGDPVVRSCIDEAYIIDTSQIVPVARQETNAPSPFMNQSAEAGSFFYQQL